MKSITFLLLATLFVVLNADSIDDMVEKIKSDRESSLDKNKLTNMTSPIPIIKTEEVNKTVPKKDNNISTNIEPKKDFVLKAVMNNMAFINDSWVKKGEKIGEYTLVDIMDDSVYLRSKEKNKTIFFKTNNSKIKITGR